MTRRTKQAPTRRRSRLPHPWRDGDVEALARKLVTLSELPTIPTVSDDEIIQSIEGMIGVKIHDRRAVMRGIDALVDVVLKATRAPIS